MQVAARLHVDAGNEPMSSARAAVVLTRSHLSRPTALSWPYSTTFSLNHVSLRNSQYGVKSQSKGTPSLVPSFKKAWSSLNLKFQARDLKEMSSREGGRAWSCLSLRFWMLSVLGHPFLNTVKSQSLLLPGLWVQLSASFSSSAALITC